MPVKKESSQGLLIAFDGLDSSGKATQVRELVVRLEHVGWRVHHWQSPDYTTPSGKELQQRLKGKLGDWNTTAWEEKMRYFATNRAEHKEEVVAALAAGDIVVYDRYVPSSVAFITIEALSEQETARRRVAVQEAVRQEEYVNQGMPKEDISIFLDVSPPVASLLLEKRKAAHNHDNEYTDHRRVQERLYQEYDFITKRESERWLRINCVAGTQLLGIAAVNELVWEGLIRRFPQLTKG